MIIRKMIDLLVQGGKVTSEKMMFLLFLITMLKTCGKESKKDGLILILMGLLAGVKPLLKEYFLS